MVIDDERWAAVSFRLYSEELDLLAIEKISGTRSPLSGSVEGIWAWEADHSLRLEDQLSQFMELAKNVSAGIGLLPQEVIPRLYISVTPSVPQDSFLFSIKLLNVLSSMKAEMVIDTLVDANGSIEDD